MAKSKLPWMQFHPKDWLHDLRGKPMSLWGIWLGICIAIWEHGENGSLTTSINDLAHFCGADYRLFHRQIPVISRLNIGDFTFHENGQITVTSRRIARDLHRREQNRKAKEKERAKSAPKSAGETRDNKKTLSESPPKRRSRSRYSPEVQMNAGIVEEYLHLVHEAEWGCQYPMSFGKDRAIIYRLVQKLEVDLIKKMMDRLIELVKDPRETWFKSFSLEVLEKYQHRLLQDVQKEMREEEMYG